jgi:hypothetical protein
MTEKKKPKGRKRNEKGRQERTNAHSADTEQSKPGELVSAVRKRTERRRRVPDVN